MPSAAGGEPPRLRIPTGAPCSSSRADGPAPGEPFLLTTVAALRLQQRRGDRGLRRRRDGRGRRGNRLRRRSCEILDGAVPILHDPPGSIRRWRSGSTSRWRCRSPCAAWPSSGLGLAARHDLEQLAGAAGLPWRADRRSAGDGRHRWTPASAACAAPDESLFDLRVASWATASRPSTGRGTPSTASSCAASRARPDLSLLDAEGNLVYVGKSRTCNRRLNSYFRESGRRSARVQKLVEPGASDRIRGVGLRSRGDAARGGVDPARASRNRTSSARCSPHGAAPARCTRS